MKIDGFERLLFFGDDFVYCKTNGSWFTLINRFTIQELADWDTESIGFDTRWNVCVVFFYDSLVADFFGKYLWSWTPFFIYQWSTIYILHLIWFLLSWVLWNFSSALNWFIISVIRLRSLHTTRLDVPSMCRWANYNIKSQSIVIDIANWFYENKPWNAIEPTAFFQHPCRTMMMDSFSLCCFLPKSNSFWALLLALLA